MTRVLVRLVDFYRRRISPLLPPLCRFEPSCSAYARQALLVHGAAKGTVLAIWRVLRCNPLCRGGFDPVPAKGRWRGGPEGGGATADPPRVPDAPGPPRNRP